MPVCNVRLQASCSFQAGRDVHLATDRTEPFAKASTAIATLVVDCSEPLHSKQNLREHAVQHPALLILSPEPQRVHIPSYPNILELELSVDFLD